MTDHSSIPGLTAVIKDWEYNPNHNVYWGRIFNDAKHRWPDGALIHTSDVRQTDEYQDFFIIHTLYSIYLLWKKDKKGRSDGASRNVLGP